MDGMERILAELDEKLYPVGTAFDSKAARTTEAIDERNMPSDMQIMTLRGHDSE